LKLFLRFHVHKFPRSQPLLEFETW